MAKRKAEPPKVVDDRGQMLVPLGGYDYVLRPSEEAIANIERQLGRSLYQLATAAPAGGLSLDDMAVIIAEMMRAYGKANPDDPAVASYCGAKTESLRGMIYEAGAPSIVARLSIVLVGAMAGGYTASGEARAAGN